MSHFPTVKAGQDFSQTIVNPSPSIAPMSIAASPAPVARCSPQNCLKFVSEKICSIWKKISCFDPPSALQIQASSMTEEEREKLNDALLHKIVFREG